MLFARFAPERFTPAPDADLLLASPDGLLVRTAGAFSPVIQLKLPRRTRRWLVESGRIGAFLELFGCAPEEAADTALIAEHARRPTAFINALDDKLHLVTSGDLLAIVADILVQSIDMGVFCDPGDRRLLGGLVSVLETWFEKPWSRQELAVLVDAAERVTRIKGASPLMGILTQGIGTVRTALRRAGAAPAGEPAAGDVAKTAETAFG